MRTGANRGEAPGTDSVPSASGGPADPSGEELTALGSMAHFSFQKQFPLPILPPPCPWPDVAHEWFSRSGEAGSTGARGAGPTVEPREYVSAIEYSDWLVPVFWFMSRCQQFYLLLLLHYHEHCLNIIL